MDAIIDFLSRLALEQRLIALGLLFVADWGLGIAIAVVRGEFDWHKLPDFIQTSVWDFGVSYAAMHLLFLSQSVLTALPKWGVVVNETSLAAAWAAVVVKFVLDIKDKVLTFIEAWRNREA